MNYTDTLLFEFDYYALSFLERTTRDLIFIFSFWIESLLSLTLSSIEEVNFHKFYTKCEKYDILISFLYRLYTIHV